MELSVSDVAKRAGCSVRTLHYYDEIGLLRPSRVTEAGYRLYDEAAVGRLQQILFYRELELPLGEISRILASPEYDAHKTLQDHRELLLLKRRRLEELIGLVDATLGGEKMKQPKTTLEDIQAAKQKYAQEVKEKWGGTEAYAESQKRHAGYTNAQEQAIGEDADAIFAAFAQSMDLAPEDEKAQALVRRWQEHITQYHYPCTKEILSGLAEMYVGDPRFKENLDRFGDGNAQFMHDAIKAYCR